MAYDFHYTPTGTGVISGKEVLEQTEDAINDLGNTAISGVQEALDKAEQALTNSANAVDDAQTALNTANNAEGVAIQAQNDVGNLSGTVTNIGNRVTTAEGNISNLQGRMTTAEGNITNIQGRMTTAETNIGNLQTAVSTAQATANSAQQTATTARQQSYVFRYSGTAVVPNSTIAYSTIDNTDNIKSGDKILDVDGKLFEITAVDTTNQTVTVGSALIDLALDANVVHTNRNDDVSIPLNSTSAELGVTGGSTNITFLDKNGKNLSGLTLGNYGSSKLSYARLNIFDKDTNNNEIQNTLEYAYVSNNNNAYLRVSRDNFCALGTTSYRWKGVYAQSYYYGSDNVEFSTKFVTTDTDQTISGTKTFTDNNMIKTSSPKVLLINTSQTGNTAPSSNTASFLRFDGGTVNNFGGVQCEFLTTGENRLTNYVKDITIAKLNTIQQRASSTTAMTIFNADLLAPANDGVTALGSNSKRWSDCQTKLINGLTPSSLGMPNVNINSFVDISGYFTNTGTGEFNTYPVTANGWIFLRLSTISSCQASVLDSNSNLLYGTTLSGGIEQILVPVIAGTTFQTQWATASTVVINKAYFIPCQGNI